MSGGHDVVDRPVMAAFDDVEAALTEARRRLRQAEMLLEISRRVAALESLDDVLETLIEIVAKETDAERGTLFLNDEQTGELYSRVAMGGLRREIRIANTSGIAGCVFQHGEGLIVHDAYADPRFNRTIDQVTGFTTRSIICAPVRAGDTIIGVVQSLNKRHEPFTDEDLRLLDAMTSQAAATLRSTQFVERMRKSRAKEMEYLDMVVDVTSDIELGSLLRKVMGEATRMLNADRSTLFLNDEKTGELWSQIGEGLGATAIRFPNHLGIAGAVFTSGETINIPYAYADLRFNPAVDRKTGFFTRSILCVPVVNKAGKVIGATQVINKRGGPFTAEDEQRLGAFTAQVSVALENAKLFADVQHVKNYNESMLHSLSNGVVTVDEAGGIVTCNAAAHRILGTEPADVLGRKLADLFVDANAWVVDRAKRVEETQVPDISMDAELEIAGDCVSVNLTVLPLQTGDDQGLGLMLMLEDISTEKRVKSTMARYMDPGLADRFLKGGENLLGGKSSVATVLFSDIRSFTSVTEELGPQGTVSLLNEYFTIMVDCVQRQGGMLDKFIGDAIMAAFGIPVPHEDDEDRAVRAAIAMVTELFAWNRGRIEHGKKPIDMGIGLNTDKVVSGNIGSPKRMDYTLIGDGVNLAARLESACAQYGARILISEQTYRKLRGIYRIRNVDHVLVKGKTEPVGVYEVLDYHTPETFPEIMEALNHFKDGLEKYRAGRWDPAIAAFTEALQLNPRDKLSQIYIDRCCQLAANPPADWKGIWILTSK